MKKIVRVGALPTLSLFALPSLLALPLLTASLFANTALAADIHVQAQGGFARVADINAKPGLLNDPDLSGTLKYDYDPAYGLELGLANFEQHEVLRLGFAWQKLTPELQEATVIDNALLEYSTFTRDELKADGYDFDADIELYSANLYYDIPLGWSFKPYVGIGTSLIDMELSKHKESGLVYSAGGLYEISEHVQVGIKYQHLDFDDFEDQEGDIYEGLAAGMWLVTLGVSF